MSDSKREKLIKTIENHLRKTSRKLIKIDTEEEALQYLIDSFRSDLYCDFAGVILNEGGNLYPKAWSGSLSSVVDSFPLSSDECSPKLFHQSLTYETAEAPEKCRLTQLLKQADVQTWFTVPLKDDTDYLGFCIVGFLNHVPLLDMETHFEEFGKDMAVAITVARQKEAQLKKIKGIEWISKNLSLDSPLEQHIAELTSMAGKWTNADFACIYLYNEKENCFFFQPPAYGNMECTMKIMVQDSNLLKEHFPFLEMTGGTELTIPLVIDLKTIGVLHIENKKNEPFTEDDLRMLVLLSNHVAATLENARLYNREKDHKQRLRFLLDYQQALIKETVEVDNFDGITSMLCNLFQDSVILFDRFLRPISFSLYESESCSNLPEQLAERAKEVMENQSKSNYFTLPDPNVAGSYFSLWPVSGGDSLLGYLAVRMYIEEMDEFDRMMVDMARNICSIHFMKQKLILGAKEQAKDSFVSKLLMEKIEDEESILQYANLFQWDLFQPHRLAVLSICLNESETEGSNLLEQQSKKMFVWDYIKSRLQEFDQTILSAYHDERYILIVPVKQEGKHQKKFWASLYDKFRQWSLNGQAGYNIFMGIGGKTEKLQDYYVSYQESIQALNVVTSRFREVGFSLFEELGSYTILHHLDHSSAVDLFVKKQIGPLLKYSEGKNIDLLNTLHVFLQNNGNVKSTAEELYIHRSSLLYRLEKAESLLEVDLNDAEVRFNLMMALKLYDMHRKLG